MTRAARSNALRMLFHFLHPFRGQVALSVLLGAAATASGIGLLGTSAYLIATAALHPSVADLQVAIVGVRFFGISRAVFRYLERLVSHSVNFRLLAELRTWFYRLLEPLAPARLQEERSADLLSRAIGDIETLENFYVRVVAPPLVALIVTAGVCWFVGRFDLRLPVLLASALLTAGVGLPGLVHLLARSPGKVAVERRAELNAALLDIIQGMPDLLAYGQGEAYLRRASTSGKALYRAQSRLAWIGAAGNALALFISGLAVCGTLLLAVPLVRDASSRVDGISLVVLVLVAMASFEVVTPLSQAAQFLESSLQAARRLFALVDTEPEVTAPPHPAPLSGDRLALTIRGLAFSYPGDRSPVLSGLDLDLPPGKHVALIGPSGAGKTTLINLLLRFWEFDSGQILINSCDIRGFHPADVRRMTAVISQATYLFAGTLRQNLLIARPGAAPGDLEQVIWQAQLEPLVERLPRGLDTWVGEHGSRLSGGERQRVAVARALLRDAPLLLLDEPTANLDPLTEQNLLASLQVLSTGRSVIAITHRLVGFEDMDEILLLEEGKITERGSHADLLALGRQYRHLWMIQRGMM